MIFLFQVTLRIKSTHNTIYHLLHNYPWLKPSIDTVLCISQGRLEEAKRCFLEAIRIQPSFAVAWSNLAGVFKDQGDLETAVAYYNEAIRLTPEFADAYSNLGKYISIMIVSFPVISLKTPLSIFLNFKQLIVDGNLFVPFFFFCCFRNNNNNNNN